MLKLFQSLAKSRAVKRDAASRLHSVIRSFGYSVIALFLPCSLLAAETGSIEAPGGGVVKYTNADKVEKLPNGQIVLVYTNAGADASFELPGASKARILAIGGGGGGAGTYYKGNVGFSGLFGGGGGGGAGGFVEVTNLFSAATYTVSVGAGGAGGIFTSDSEQRAVDTLGEDGGQTAITTNGVAMITAFGGGGGGSETDGRDGASGGGGSQQRNSKTESTPKDGGSGIAGQGNAGGAGDDSLYGGGGGGAGGVGDAASTHDPKGGIGRQSDITGQAVYYAGGGGGSYIDISSAEVRPGIGLGYDYGGGGLGGYGSKVEPTPGLDGFGGGGGGCCASPMTTTGGARGGSGVVYIRISAAMEGPFEKPATLVVSNYTGEAIYSVKPNVFYDVTGDYCGTNVGTYVAWAKLKGGTWPDGTKDDVEITLKIEKCPVTVENLRYELDGVITNAWRFGAGTLEKSEKLPTLACDVTPEHAKGALRYEYKSTAEGEEWNASCPTNAGDYVVHVALTNADNYVLVAEPTFDFTIEKRGAKFSDLMIRSWMAGTPEKDTPNPSCTVAPTWVEKVYEWKAKGEGEGWTDWSKVKPTEIGNYEMRVGAPNVNDYDFDYATCEFSIFGGLGDVYTDYIEITVTNRTDVPLTNFPYEVTLSETDPVGFTYSRAGATGDDMAFTDAGGNEVYYYKVVDPWDTNGVSTVDVRLPLLEAHESQVIRLYWRVRTGAVPPVHHPELVWADWEKRKAEWAVLAAQIGESRGAVYKDGKFINYWVSEPLMSSTYWDINDPEEKKGTITNEARLAFGDVIRTITNFVNGLTYDDVPHDVGGLFRVSYVPDDPLGEYEPLECHVDFSVVTHTPYTNLTGNAGSLTLSGRVLLANDDDAEGNEVRGQSYWQEREVPLADGTVMTNDIYWTHGGEEHGAFLEVLGTIKNMLPWTEHRLKYMDGGVERTLWRLGDVIIGNVFPSVGVLYDSQCALPYSSTQRGISKYEAYSKKGDMQETGNLILRNRENAVIYSPCYTNGIGTIYFDAVNAFCDNQIEKVNRIVVEIATETEKGLPPTDENAYREGAKTLDDELGLIAKWTPYEMHPLYRDGPNATSFTVLDPTNSFSLMVAERQTTNHFYRFYVPVNLRKPARFRIRRPNADIASGKTADNSALLLVDNIVVSYPKMGADMAPYGIFDPDRGGKLTLGTEGAAMTPFPAVGEDIVMRGKAVTYVNGAIPDANPAGFINRALLHYQWTYLDQATSAWKSVELTPGDRFRAQKPLEGVPAFEGDIRYWYEINVNVPYYTFFDYSGLNLGAGGYSEEQTSVTNRNENWFIRLRNGRSDYEGWRMFVKGAEEPIEMTLTGDRVWRGYVQTIREQGVTNLDLQVRFEAYNRQTPGSETFVTNAVHRYVLASNVRDISVPSSLTDRRTGGEPVGPDDWSHVTCETRAGYLVFQVAESSRAVTIVRAEYQNFNRWNDAKREIDGKPVFRGTAWYGEDGASGTSERAREYKEDFRTWPLSSATHPSKLWWEPFDVTEEQMREEGGQFEVFVPFSENKSPNGFTVGAGQWVTSYYRDYSSGMALQMEGCGRGYIQFVNGNESPRGLESITFRPRLAQAIEFGDFSVYSGDALALTNYTFTCRAAFDVNQNKDYTGNASLSVVAFYNAGTGCYELRVEQENAIVTKTETGDEVKPGNKRLISLYKWAYDDFTGEIIPTLLGSSPYDDTNVKMLRTAAETGASAKYALMFISAKDYPKDKKTEICAGITLEDDTVPSTSGKNARWLVYTDTAADRHENGSYGFLSANCPARFRYLWQGKTAQTMPTDAAAITGSSVKVKDQTFTPLKTTTGQSCWSSIQKKGGWAIQKRRAEKINEGDGEYFGFKAPEITNQTVSVYLAPPGSDAFDLKKPALFTTNVTSFGKVGAAATVTLPLWSLEECSVRIAAGGTAKGARNDVVLDDLEFRQWRGDNYDGKEGVLHFEDTRYGSPTNFVYTQAWNSEVGEIPEEAYRVCQLSAKRSGTDEPTSIRSPLMDGEGGRGKGLGMIAFSYENAQSNVNVLVQIATNGVSRQTFADTTHATADDAQWTTVTNFNFATEPETNRLKGVRSVYFGLHDVVGAMRIVLDPTNVVLVAGTNVTDEAKFGSIDITGVLCRDEPSLDETSWWGWNLRTTDLKEQRYLWDAVPEGVTGVGLSFALNNSTHDDTVPEEEAAYRENLPFLQTPTVNADTFGEINFKARKYDASDEGLAHVVLYGAHQATAQASDWKKLKAWDVGATLYTNCSYRANPGDSYCAFRLAVTGVRNVTDPMEDDTAPENPLRILLEEVTVMDAIRARIAFRNTAAFRSNLDSNRAIADILSKAEQPLCHESFGVQTEIYPAQLESEVDLSSAQVNLWWYWGDDVWGWQNWTNRAGAKHAPLALAEGTNDVWRSSYPAAMAAVIDPVESAGVMQYALEVVYKVRGDEPGRWVEKHDWIEKADWEKPSWYHPVDFNRDRAKEGFSPYTILDEVAPGYAWINEVNMYDGPNEYDDISKTNQYVEIAVPAEADISGWRLEFITGGLGSSPVYFTNNVALFGDIGDVIGTKSVGGASNYVFITVGNPKSCTAETKAAGTIDGAWMARGYSSDQSQLNSDGTINAGYPIAMQLVRPTGIIEHQLVIAGTNSYADLPAWSWQFSATNFLAKLRQADPEGTWFFPGEDIGEHPLCSQSATNQFAAEGMWKHEQKTPGRINGGEYIDPDHPTPQGSSIILYANIEGGHVYQASGKYAETTKNLILYANKDPDLGYCLGTDIVYRVAHWYEIDSITEDGVPRTEYEGAGADGLPFAVTVAKGARKNVTVTARARINRDLRETYGLTDRNPYTPAIMKWLEDGTTFRGEFADKLGSVKLAEYREFFNDNFITNLTLTDMYWLDMDPTKGGLALKLGATVTGDRILEDGRHIVDVNAYMMITNREDETDLPYTPYTIRGIEPDSSSADYAGVWTAATFRVTGYLLGSKDMLDLDYYVFGPNSFHQPGEENAFQSHILLDWPYAPPSPGYYHGWGAHTDKTIGYRLKLDGNVVPIAPQILVPAD